jgi:ceramide glucosyltransferase
MFLLILYRWIRLRTSMIPFPSLLEPLIDCFVMGLLSSLVFSYLLGYSFFLFYGFHICIVMVSDYILLRNLQNGPLLNWKMLFLAWWVRELLALPIYLHGVSSRKVRWKDREFTLMCGGQVKETTPPPKHIISVWQNGIYLKLHSATLIHDLKSLFSACCQDLYSSFSDIITDVLYSH